LIAIDLPTILAVCVDVIPCRNAID